MKQRLQTRFLLAGGLLLVATTCSSLWSIWTFLQLHHTVDEAIRANQEIIDACAELHSSLEREDDALLLFLSGDVTQARSNLIQERRRGDVSLNKLITLISSGEEQAVVMELRQQIERYRAAGDLLQQQTGTPEGLPQYHLKVNPLLRQAVSHCDRLREAGFRAMHQASLRVRDEAARGSWIVITVAILSVILGVAVLLWLARSVLEPIQELMQAVEAFRKGDFNHRVQHHWVGELGQLAAEFNRLAEAIAEYRRSSLGELITIKMTLEATLNALPDAVLVFDPDGILVDANPLARKILAEKNAPLRSSLNELPLSDSHRQLILHTLAGSPTAVARLDLDRTLNVVLDGRLRRFLLKVVPIPDFAPQRCGAVAVLDDVTELAQLDELRSELIAVASHELKSPLTAIQMNLMMLREAAGNLPERLQQILDTALAGCEELRLTVDEFLDLTLIEAGQLRLHFTPVDLRNVVHSVIQSFQTRFTDAGAQLEIQMPSTPLVVQGDAKRLQSVLANVLSNALKYSPAGGTVVITVSCRQNAQGPERRWVQIAVTDQGPGVPDEFRDRIFEKFFRVEHHLGHRGKTVRGTGIGLYLCRQIIHSHGGTITCEAGPDGCGTRIAISIPIDRARSLPRVG